jgi:hypothetical protein
MWSGVLRGFQIYSSLLPLPDVQGEIAQPLSTTAGAAAIWYLNLDPTPSDISDKSGRGHHPAWVGPLRPDLWTGPEDTPALSVAPSSLSFAAAAGGAPPESQTLAISDGGAGTMDWTVSETAGWLSATPSSGTDAGIVTVGVDSTGLAAGVHTATLTVAAPDAPGSPATIPVTLTLSAEPTTIALSADA